jgi:hypothetical protein
VGIKRTGAQVNAAVQLRREKDAAEEESQAEKPLWLFRHFAGVHATCVSDSTPSGIPETPANAFLYDNLRRLLLAWAKLNHPGPRRGQYGAKTILTSRHQRGRPFVAEDE